MKEGPRSACIWHRSGSAKRGLAKQAMPQEASWEPVRKRTSRRFHAPKPGAGVEAEGAHGEAVRQ